MVSKAEKKKILFVDDEPNVLNGLKRMLRSMRNEWDMTFASGGQEALDILVDTAMDVVVSDMRMPHIDGVRLLTEVKQRYPNTVRIILSGQAEEEAILRSIGPSHQFLSKPCDPTILKQTVSRACALRDLLENGHLRNAVSQLCSLPSMPSLYVNLLELLKEPDCTARHVSAIIEKDMGMLAKVLQLVNSAYFGPSRKVNSAKEAVTMLGMDVIKSLVFSVQVFSQFDQDKVSCLSIDELWQHSLGVGILARRIAQVECQDQRIINDAFIAGVMHDAGKLILALNLPEQYSKTIALTKEKTIPHWKAELEVFGTSHAEVGAYLLGLWGLPNSIVEAVAYHHTAQECPGDEFSPLTAVHVADAIYVSNTEHVADIFDHADKPVSNIGQPYDVDGEYLDRLNLTDRLPLWHKAALEERTQGVPI